MAQARRTELRLFDDSEKELVEASRHPLLAERGDEELATLRKTLRERRDRARDIASRQRREMRGKAAPSGAKPASDNAGSREKFAALSAALQRVNGEIARRKRFSSRKELKRNAEKALEMRRAASRPNRPTSRRAKKGMRSVPNERGPDLVNPMEVGRVSQFVKNGQARRDSR
ncbi:hypothetical protein SAMN05880561_103132 [Rhizobium sp. RU33A]|uniref:hypothetical protein n=1 Tax=Rhizobium sp. RU33A TaxID=1907413 RepID=UPI00095749FE|nr:hypothetical protein [Rhizobium sp. RU33A]SIQ47808.1 hypothetical protein SAMN05880561_103132 [Rhizobium sp. RU33A]